MIEICAVGGFNEIGKNMTAVKVDDEVIILDMGIYLPVIINMEEEERINISRKQLIELGAIADDDVIKDWKHKVKAIVLGHCHLDHIAGIPFLAPHYDAPIIATPFTLEVLKTTLKDDDKIIPNKLKPLNINSSIKISKNITIEFINITHSTLQCVMIAIHTPYGVVLYANDCKFDDHPVIGQKPNYKRLKQLNGNVKVIILESLYAHKEGKTPSEKVAKEMLKDVMLGIKNTGNAIFVTTFASHIARLKSILEFGRKLNRKVVFLGRSMAKYINAAEKLDLIKFSKSSEIFPFRNQINKQLQKIEQDRGKYLVICTGSQGEPGSILDKIVKKQLSFEFIHGDQVIFSCRTIPVEINEANREMLEAKLKQLKVRIFTDIHVSGHSSKEDLRDLIKTVAPENIIPAHCDSFKANSLAELAIEEGYEIDKNIHIMGNGKRITI